MRFYDVIYSFPAHEESDCVIDFIKNIFYFNRSIKVFIIVNANLLLFETLQDKMKDIENVCLYPIPEDKTSQLFKRVVKSQTNNFFHCYSKCIHSQYFIPLTSDCYFHKDTTLSDINRIYESSQIAIPPKQEGWLWPCVHANINIYNLLVSIGFTTYYRSQHEGAILPYEIMKINSSIIKDGLIEQIYTQDMPFEEYIYPTIFSTLTGKEMPYLCDFRYRTDELSFKELEEIQKPCIKRVFRKLDSPLRKAIREKANNYTF
jgi:hypothetical protein